MCDLDLDLVVAAHILPVAASGSMDIVPNGIALCENHHRLFDSHRVLISPGSFQVHLHPILAKQAKEDDVSRQLVEALNLSYGPQLTQAFKRTQRCLTGAMTTPEKPTAG